jgi:hypothetical protein
MIQSLSWLINSGFLYTFVHEDMKETLLEMIELSNTFYFFDMHYSVHFHKVLINTFYFCLLIHLFLGYSVYSLK